MADRQNPYGYGLFTGVPTAPTVVTSTASKQESDAIVALSNRSVRESVCTEGSSGGGSTASREALGLFFRLPRQPSHFGTCRARVRILFALCRPHLLCRVRRRSSLPNSRRHSPYCSFLPRTLRGPRPIRRPERCLSLPAPPRRFPQRFVHSEPGRLVWSRYRSAKCTQALSCGRRSRPP